MGRVGSHLELLNDILFLTSNFVFSMSNVLLYALIPILLNQYALTKKKLKELKLKTSFWSRHGLNLKVFRLIV